MKIIYLLLIFLIIYSLTNSPDKVEDIYYNVEYDLTQNLKKQSSYYLFRLPVKAGDKMDIEIKIPNSVSNNFLLEVYEYNYKPNDTQIYEHVKGNYLGKFLASSFYYEGDLTVYYYTFQVSQNAIKGSFFQFM